MTDRLAESSGTTGTAKSDAIAFVRDKILDAKYSAGERAEQIVDYLRDGRGIPKVPDPRQEDGVDWTPLEGHGPDRHVGEAGD